jgi:hypothetical protein
MEAAGLSFAVGEPMGSDGLARYRGLSGSSMRRQTTQVVPVTPQHPTFATSRRNRSIRSTPSMWGTIQIRNGYGLSSQSLGVRSDGRDQVEDNFGFCGSVAHRVRCRPR